MLDGSLLRGSRDDRIVRATPARTSESEHLPSRSSPVTSDQPVQSEWRVLSGAAVAGRSRTSWLTFPRTSREGAGRGLPYRDIAFVALWSLVVPFMVYLAVGLVSILTLGWLLTLVASAYAITSLAILFEATLATPRRRAPHFPVSNMPRVADPADPASVGVDAPAFTALVVAYLPNEQDIIVETLCHLLEEIELPSDRFRVLLAYNSPVRLQVEHRLREMEAADPRLQVLHVEGSRSKAENVNAALPHITTEYLGVFDADHHPEPRCFQKALRWFGAGYDVVQGRCVIRNAGATWLTRMIGIEFSTMYAVAHTARSLSVDTALFGGSNGYWRTDALRALGMDPERLTEDIDVSLRALLSGHRILHDRSIISTELAPVTLSAWFHQRLRWAQGWFQVTRCYSRALLHCPRLRLRQRLYWLYMLPWREAFALVSPQAFTILLTVIVVQVAYGGDWYWDPYLTGTTVLTVVGGVASVVAGYKHLLLAGRAVRLRHVLAFILVSPLFALFRSVITHVAWLRESRRQHEWVPTPRASGATAVLLPTSAAPATPTVRVPDTGASVQRSGRAVMTAAAVTTITAFGAALRLHTLDARSLWIDEGVSVWVARMSIGDIFSWLIRSDHPPPLYYTLLHAWMTVDDSVFWVRLLSVVFSVLTIPLVYGLGRRLRGRSLGLLAALLLAVSPFHVLHAQDARMYALLGFCATAASYCLLWGLQTMRGGAWTLYAVAVAATMYSHIAGAFVVGTHAVVLITYWLAGRRESVGGLKALAGGVGAWLPWLPFLAIQVTSGRVTWIENPSPQDLAQLTLTFTSALLPDHLNPYQLSMTALALAAGSLAVVGLGLWALREDRWKLLVAALLLMGPVVLELDASVVQPLFIDRTLIPVGVVYTVLLAAGLQWIGGLGRRAGREAVGALSVAALSVALGLNLLSLEHYYDDYEKERWDLAAAHVAEHQRPDDVILFQSNSSQLPFDYYYSRATEVPLPQAGVPCTLGDCDDFEPPLHSMSAEDRRALRERVEDHPRVWVVKRWWGNWDFAIDDAVGPVEAGRLRFVEERDVGGVVVMLYERGR